MKITDTVMNSRRTALNAIACPICKSKFILTDDGRSAVCTGARRHLYDFSSSGYLNLAPSHSSGGDDADCARARREFLSSGYYSPIRDAVCEAVREYSPYGNTVDAGCGEGYYTLGISDSTKGTVWGFDLSKPAVNAAAKSANSVSKDNLHFGIASVYELPVPCCSVDALVSIFAPCAEVEFARVVKSGGVLIIACAGEEHLIGLKRILYAETYKNEGRRDLPIANFTLSETRKVKYETTLKNNVDILSLFAMTPYYYRTSTKDKEKLVAIDTLSTTIDIDIFIYKRK